MKNLELAWQKVRQNRGAGGIDGQSIEAFEENLAENLSRLHKELKDDTYHPQPVRQKMIPKPGQPGEVTTSGDTHSLWTGMPAGVTKPVGADLRSGIR